MNIDEHSKQADKGHRKTIRKKTYKSKRFKEGENYDHNWSIHSSITDRGGHCVGSWKGASQ